MKIWYAVFLLMVFPWGQVSANANNANGLTIRRNVEIFIGSYYPSHKVLTFEILDKDVQRYFFRTYSEKSPGLACGVLRSTQNVDCGVLLVRKTDPSQGVDLFIIIKNINTKNPSVAFSETFRTSARYPFTGIFIRLLPPGIILDRETNIPLTLKYHGLEVVFFEKSAITFFWESNSIRRVYTSD